MSNENRPLLIWQLTDRGFCSELNGMVLGILYGLEQHMDFMLCSRYAGFAYQLGWRDYFEPFCEEISNPLLKHALMYRTDGLKRRSFSLIQKTALSAYLRRRLYLTRDVWRTVWNSDFVAKRFVIDSCGIDGDCYSACRDILNSIWKFNNTTQQAISAIRARIMLNDGPYFAVHIRRGDKAMEAEPLDTARYVKKVHEINRSIKTCFVMSDDYAIISELRAECPDWRILTLCSPASSGHSQRIFHSLPAELRLKEVQLFLAELAIARESLFFVGTYSSNVCRLMALLKGRELTYGVDLPYTMVY